ncbi:MAG TPA: helix-turn-helix transcriptional regulator [Candidatus Avamphibacillus sp.]|nr:helix-turn-helix transcriptional regulator [Candidatus Avamphibacillus sp.]
MDHKRVGRRIKAFRKLKGYTQVKLAKELNFPLAKLGSVERGRMEAPSFLLTQIANLLEIDEEEITLENMSIKEDTNFSNR